jgi:mRNA interferase MazF
MIEPGQVYFVSLDPIAGREMGGNKRRPVVVLSINALNRKPLVVAVVPGTSTIMRFRNMVEVLSSQTNGLSSPTYFACHQIRGIDHSRFVTPHVGWLSANDLARVEESVKFCLGIL